MIALSFLKPLTISIYAAASLVVMGCFQLATAQGETPSIIYQPDPDSPIGERNPDGPPELAQYEFLIGDWDAEITWYWPGQKPSITEAKWHNHWVVNGTIVMLEWRGTQFTGAELRQWHPAEKQWTGVNIYPDFGGGMTPTTSRKEGETMLVFMEIQSPNGAYINRETYYDIEADSYKMKSDHSFDNGETWQRGLYEMTVTRSQGKN